MVAVEGDVVGMMEVLQSLNGNRNGYTCNWKNGGMLSFFKLKKTHQIIVLFWHLLYMCYDW